MNLIQEKKVPFRDTRLQDAEEEYKKRVANKFFLHPKIPIQWVFKLNEAGSAGLRVGFVLLYCFVLKKANTIKLPKNLLESFRISRSQKSRGLKELKELGLIDICIRIGVQTEIKLLDLNETN